MQIRVPAIKVSPSSKQPPKSRFYSAGRARQEAGQRPKAVQRALWTWLSSAHLAARSQGLAGVCAHLGRACGLFKTGTQGRRYRKLSEEKTGTLTEAPRSSKQAGPRKPALGRFGILSGATEERPRPGERRRTRGPSLRQCVHKHSRPHPTAAPRRAAGCAAPSHTHSLVYSVLLYLSGR